MKSYAWDLRFTEYEIHNDRYKVSLDLTPRTEIAYFKAKLTKNGNVISDDKYTVPGQNYPNLYIECNANVTVTFHKSNDTVIATYNFTTTQIVNEGPNCSRNSGENPPPGGDPPPGGGGDEVEDPCSGYLSLINPECPDYQGGGGNPPPDGEDPPPGGGDYPPPDDGGDLPPLCDGCAVFECPKWDDYMGKIDEIISGIPTIEQAIRRQTRDIEDAIINQTETFRNEIVGTPPSLPDAPAFPDLPDTYGFENEFPEFIENPDLTDAGFTLDDLEREAPEIPFRDDPTGGFNIVNPVEALPKPPKKFPIPGETDAGEWDKGKPESVIPKPPIVELHPYMPYPPQPDVEPVGPPTPGGGGDAPVPGNEGPDASMKYKTHPENPDGV